MTEPLTVKDLNCGNCIVPHKVVNALSRHPKFYCNDVELPIATYQVVCERGCCTNPLALQVLAAPVIAELKKHPEYCMRYEEAIKLLQGDTK